MKKNKYISVFLIFFVQYSFGQIGGKSVYEFLNMINSPRQAAMGGKVITLYDYDVNQSQFNPATINEEMHNRLAVNYGNLYGGITYGTAAYAYTYDKHVNTFTAGINYVNYGKFEGYDENGVKTSSFTGSDIALSFGYGYNVPFTDWYLGGSAKLINSTYETYSSFGAAVDLGALYIDTQNDINYAISIRNVGTQITTFSGTREKVPMEVMLGISQLAPNVPIRWHLTLENMQQWKLAFSNPNRAVNSIDGSSTQEKTGFFNNALRHVIIGAELFPDKGFNLRLGYNFRRAEELRIVEQRNFSGISVGVGLKMGRIKFDYSYSRYTLASNTSLFGITINLNEDY